MNDTHQKLPEYCLQLSGNSKSYRYIFTLILITLCISLACLTKAFATEPSAIESAATKKELSATEKQHTDVDAKKLWTKSCFTCHGDSGDMARNFLKVVDGKLQGPLHKDTFQLFLTNHYLSKTKADAIYTMLLSQARAKSRFEQECSSCHQKASDLVREKLALHNGILYNRESKTPTYTFLESHRELNAEDVKFYMRKLTFIGYEIYQPIKMN